MAEKIETSMVATTVVRPADGERTEHIMSINGVDHTVLLTAEEAKLNGAKPVSAKAAVPANKSRSTVNKAGER